MQGQDTSMTVTPVPDYTDPDAPTFPSPEEIEHLYKLSLLGDIPGGFVPSEDFSRVSAMAAFYGSILRKAWHSANETIGRRTAGWVSERLLNREVKHYLNETCRDFIRSVNGISSTSPAVVFVLARISYKVLREGVGLRKKGYRCFLVTLSPYETFLEPNFDEAFDAIVTLPKNYFLLGSLVRRLRPNIFHVHCSMWEYVVARVVDERKGDAACICELDDVTTIFAERGKLHRYWPPPLIDLDYAMEGYVCTRSDALIHQFSPEALVDLRNRHGGLVRAIEMQPLPMLERTSYNDDKPSRKDGVIRLVWPGAIWAPTEANPKPMFEMAGMIEAWTSLLKQGLGVECYHDPAKHFPLDEDPCFEPYRKLRLLSPHFIFGEGVPPHRISGCINHCDFGIILTDLRVAEWETRRLRWRLLMANKFYSFLEAGLPMIVNSEFEYMAQTINDLGIGFSVRSDEIDDVAERIGKFDYDRAVKNIQKFNENNNMDMAIQRLAHLYAEVTRPAGTRQL